ncbi:50S ribosomal protein L15 [Candidatus Nomurabacteria bacterium RIFCSPLOWO2_01_FULL_33_24]|uniref:Large ribosomal subunit protein uL15 n=1 Tax=Candidatus Nomurabacteria bacterium RIFCSPLOWO2_01_FULL_33_24 TaxID=1801765 RepID=A0A1F6X226_9BACT|nr:MAG: 50S ribosomal protein L15 [Candidatus Nomurabacteria bacterium RIFCSPLOWO2_01_FULL_33_24]
MKIHQVKRNNKNKKKKTIGRGGSRGKTSGRGTKGQKSRAGHSIRPEIRDIIKKIPKKRGYRFNSIKDKPIVINLSVINNEFNNDSEINPKVLIEKLLINKKKGFIPKVKILGNGEIEKKIIVSNCLVSSKARDKIIKVGGKIIE